MVSISFSPCASCAKTGSLSSRLGSLDARCCLLAEYAACLCEDGCAGVVLGASVLVIDMVRLVGVWSSSGIGVSGRSLNGGAVDGQLPNVMMDCEELDSTSQPPCGLGSIGSGPCSSSSETMGVQRIGGTWVSLHGAVARCDGEAGGRGSGADRDRF